jgi:hypothetical protein
MLLGNLPFGFFEEIEPNIMEIIIHEGVQISEEHIVKIEQGLLDKYEGEYSLLINRKYAYSHGHESLNKISELKNASAIAIVAYSDASVIAAKMHLLYSNNIEIFTDKASALNWLRNAQYAADVSI